MFCTMRAYDELPIEIRQELARSDFDMDAEEVLSIWDKTKKQNCGMPTRLAKMIRRIRRVNRLNKR